MKEDCRGQGRGAEGVRCWFDVASRQPQSKAAAALPPPGCHPAQAACALLRMHAHAAWQRRHTAMSHDGAPASPPEQRSAAAAQVRTVVCVVVSSGPH